MYFPFYLSVRYFKSKKNRNTVNIIVGFSIVALTFSTAVMLILLSAFSGLQSMNIHFISDVNPEIKISSQEGKYLKNLPQVEKTLRTHPEVITLSKEIEEKVYLTYRERSEVAKMKAVDSEFKKIFPLDTTLIAGDYFSEEYSNEMLLSNPLAFRLNIPLNDSEYAQLYVPKPGKGRIMNLEDNFTIKPAYMRGVFYINDHYDQTLFVPLEFAQELLTLAPHTISNLNVKLKDPSRRDDFKNEISQVLGADYLIQTREDQDASFLRMMNIERLMIYLIMALVTIITTFTLAGAVVIIIIDKKPQTIALMSLGLDRKNIKASYFLTGLIITGVGIFLGLIIGTLTILMQQKFEWVKVNSYLAFPVELQSVNYLIVIFTVLFFGTLVSYVSSRKLHF